MGDREYRKLAEQWKDKLRKVFKDAPKEEKESILRDADLVIDEMLPSISRASNTGKKVFGYLTLHITARRCGVRVPVSTGMRPIPHIPMEGKERAEWKRRVNEALNNLTAAQYKELEDEVYRRSRDSAFPDQVRDAVRAQFTQIGG